MLTNQIQHRSLSNTFGRIIQGYGSKNILDLDNEEVINLFRESGTLLFNNFGTDADTFMKFTQLYCKSFSTYQGGGLRWGVLDRQAINNIETLLTTSGHSQGFPIELHGEMYYLKNHPTILWFYCENPPIQGGQTTVSDGREIFKNLSDETKKLFQSQKIKYVRQQASGEWQTTFQTDDLNIVQKFCDENETKLSINSETGAITTEYVCSAIVKSRDGEDVFINNLLLIYIAEWAFQSGWFAENLKMTNSSPPLVVRMEDGSCIPEHIIEELQQICDNLTIDIQWEKGDVLMIDNTKILHGRREATASNRKIFVRMGEPIFQL
ncbi:MAG: TauD/TfdA family dioxygenase [Tolypothrix carrinoi HA7290-LM1]|jgi:alpha-ketoglutarate-dependent taurine dioxygenase|nr:TauD/TfdA family dioxygenase [Tolypothrix carrinoi HA7290-LM1]